MWDLRDLRGCGTALVTPFHSKGEVDEAALRRLVTYQLQEGIDFLVPCGTTGESPTLGHEEYLRVISLVVKEAKGKVPVVAGAGGNCTRKVIDLIQALQPLDVDGILSVSPYYNKPTQEGLYQHYCAIAASTDLPIILYNVPSRTSSNIAPQTVARLSRIPNIVGVKEASGNLVQVSEIVRTAEPGFRVISGDDALTLPMIGVGGVGVISVAANEAPGPMSKLVRLALENHWEEARKLNAHLLPLMQANFIETSPIPVKAALAMMGLIKEVYRLPLVPMSTENRTRLEKVLYDVTLLKREKAPA